MGLRSLEPVVVAAPEDHMGRRHIFLVVAAHSLVVGYVYRILGHSSRRRAGDVQASVLDHNLGGSIREVEADDRHLVVRGGLLVGIAGGSFVHRASHPESAGELESTT
jgi:hypothetical protein